METANGNQKKKTDSVYSASIVKNISNFQKGFFFSTAE